MSKQGRCFITPSFAGDFERCRLLVESRRLMAPEIRHYIIVDAPDFAQFRQLACPTTIVLDSREFMHPAFHKLPGRNGWWWSVRTPPLRGWMTQQIRKFAIAESVDADVVISLDSDVVFIRPFDGSVFTDAKGRTALFSVDYRNAQVEAWTKQAARLLGAPNPSVPNNYISTMIPWNRKHVRDMLTRLEQRTGEAWQLAIARLSTFSECQLYGYYIEEMLGHDAAHTFPFTDELVKLVWTEGDSRPCLETVFTGTKPQNVAVMVHSKDGFSPKEYEPIVRRFWERHDANDITDPDPRRYAIA